MSATDYRQVYLADKHGEIHVFLDPAGDHIVTLLRVSQRGELYEVQMPEGWAYDRIIRRAQRAVAFL